MQANSTWTILTAGDKCDKDMQSSRHLCGLAWQNVNRLYQILTPDFSASKERFDTDVPQSIVTVKALKLL